MPRLLDCLFAIVLLLLLSPVLLVVALFIRLSSPGPVFFRQQRIGKDGKPFSLYKFRSMRVGNTGPAVTAGDDPRITPIGRHLRHYKLDELPQLLNVIHGDMSLVGPRPEVEKYVRYYTDEQRQVLSVRPGITGLTQLEFRHEETLLKGRDDAEQFYITELMPAKLAIDLRYLRERSLSGDLRILYRTLARIIQRSPEPETAPKLESL